MNSVSAAVTDARLRPSVRTRRTALTYGDGRGFDLAGTEFADLSRDPAPVEAGGRIYSPANLVASVAAGLVQGAGPAAGAVATYPAVYSDKQVALLRQALDLSGSREVLLVPEPVAAAEWLEFEQGPLDPGFVLVYDLGATSLDVAVVRVGPDWTDHPVVGKPLRSYEFGGRPLGSLIARYARAATPDGMVASLPARDIEDLRVAHIRKSFGLVRACVRSSGRAFADIDHILVVGGAARPAEVSYTLTELGRPVVMSADPGQCCAAGAAHFAARVFAPAETTAKAPRVAVFSSAAVASALAMSAATVFGGSVQQGSSPILEILPGTDVLTDTLLYDPRGDTTFDRLIRDGVPLALERTVAAVRPVHRGYGQTLASTTRNALMGPTIEESGGSRLDPHATSLGNGMLYGDPANFVNPIPFKIPAPRIDLPDDEDSPHHPRSAEPHDKQIPEVSLPPSRTTSESGGTAAPSDIAGHGSQAPGSGHDHGGSGASEGAASSGGASTSTDDGDTSPGASGGSGGGGSDGGGSDGGYGGGASSGGGDAGAAGSGDGGSTGGSAASGGSASGGAGSGGPAGGGASGGGASGGGASNGGASGGGHSHGNPSGGAGGMGGKLGGGGGGGVGGGGKIGGGGMGGLGGGGGMGGGMGGARGK
ncbi:hypothetical protein [Nocardia arizonensis]|uniref:hypothetical protein n=1 Tax=Nocardia arizonensis TaxID=1141647 RepID=UPI0012E0D003|nr:hypothetical protein [Nocardia arizonensis]